MLDSDAPKPISDNVYIPQDRKRKVNESEETSDDGGSFSFVFYDRNAQQKKGQQKKQPADIGDPVKLNLSQGAKLQTKKANDEEKAEEENNEEEAKAESSLKDSENKTPVSGADGHINITV